METGVVTIKGQVVIPSKIRHRLGIKKGTKVCFIQKNDEIILKLLTPDYFEKMAGILNTKGQIAKSLLESRKLDRKKEDKR